MKKSKKNSKKKTKIRKEKKSRIKKRVEEIIPPMKFNPALNSFEVDIDKLKEIIQEETLEEHIEDSEIVEDNEFHAFLASPPSKNISPVLEKIQAAEETDLENNIISTPISRATPETNIMDYSASQNYLESNYNEAGRGYAPPETPSPVLERTRVSESIQKTELLNWQDIRAREHSSFAEKPERLSIRNVEERRELPFEKAEKKYKELKR